LESNFLSVQLHTISKSKAHAKCLLAVPFLLFGSWWSYQNAIEGQSRLNESMAHAWFGLFVVVSLFMPPIIWRYSELIFTGFPYGELISSIKL